MLRVNPYSFIMFGTKKAKPVDENQYSLFDLKADTVELSTKNQAQQVKPVPESQLTEKKIAQSVNEKQVISSDEKSYWRQLELKIDEYLDGKGKYFLRPANDMKREKSLKYILSSKEPAATEIFLIKLLEKLPDQDNFKVTVIQALTDRQIPKIKGSGNIFYIRSGKIIDALVKDIVKDKDELQSTLSEYKKGWFFTKSIALTDLQKFMEMNNYHDNYKIKKVKTSLQEYLEYLTAARQSLKMEKFHPLEAIIQGFLGKL